MRILFFTHYFPPEVNAPANRTHEHCRVWAAAGHDVHVITCVPSHPAGKPFHGYRRRWYQHEQIDGIHVHRVWTHLAPNRGTVRRTLNYLSFAPSAFFRALRLGTFDVIVGTSPQFFCAMAACATASVRRIPFVFELRDLWPESIAAVGAVRQSFALRMLERLELAMYRRASAVVCVTQSFMHNLTGRGVDAGKLHFVPNGIVPSMWDNGSRDSGRWRLQLGADEVAVSYIGTLGMAHDIDTVLDAAESLRMTHPKIRFIIVGDGAHGDRLLARAKAGLANVTFTGLLPRPDIADLMAATDISLVTLKPSDTFKAVLPSKMFEAMAARRPVVLAVEGEAEAVLTRSGGGLAVEPGNARKLADAVATLASDPERRRRLGTCGGEYVRREFNRSVWARRYLELLKELTDRVRQPSTSLKPGKPDTTTEVRMKADATTAKSA